MRRCLVEMAGPGARAVAQDEQVREHVDERNVAGFPRVRGASTRNGRRHPESTSGICWRIARRPSRVSGLRSERAAQLRSAGEPPRPPLIYCGSRTFSMIQTTTPAITRTVYGKFAGIELRERRGALLAGAPPVRPAIALRLSPTASRSAFCDAASRFYRGLTMPSFALSESPDSRGDYDGAHCPRKVKLLCALQL